MCLIGLDFGAGMCSELLAPIPWAFLEYRFGPELARGPVRCVITEQVLELSRAAQSRMWWYLSVSNTCSLYPLPNNPLGDKDPIALSFYLQVLHSA